MQSLRPLEERELIAAHLKYSNVAEPLRIRAQNQLILKILYLIQNGEYISIESIREGIADISGGAAPARDEIAKAVDALLNQGLIENRYKKWRLSNLARSQLASQLAQRRNRVNAILAANFSSLIEAPALLLWFEDACIDLFLHFGGIWTSASARSGPFSQLGRGELSNLLGNSLRKHKLETNADALLSGFTRFLRSNDRQETEHIFSLGMSMFGSRLVAAGNASDPITTREFRGATFLLDTNVLLTFALDGPRIDQSLAALELACSNLSCSFAFLPVTEVEYKGVIERWRTLSLSLMQKYSAEVVLQSDDEYMVAARNRGCKTFEDIDNFFSSIASPPSFISDSFPISKLEDATLNDLALKGATDPKLVSEIQSIWSAMRPFNKSQKSAAHDAALCVVSRFLNSQRKKTIVLSTDFTMHHLALRWSHPNGEPLWVPLESFIQVLALDCAGTNIDGVEFAPLFSNLIANEFEIPDGEYKLEDLQWLEDIEQGVSELGQDNVTALAQLIHRLRLSGMNRYDPELVLAMQRSFQAAKKNLAGDVSEARRRIAHEENNAIQERKKREKSENSHKARIRKDILKTYRVRLGAEVFVCLVVFSILAYFTGQLLPILLGDAKPADALKAAWVAVQMVLFPAIAIWKYFYPAYRKKVENLPNVVQCQFEKESQLS